MKEPQEDSPFDAGPYTDSSASTLCALIQEQLEVLWAIYLEATEPPGKITAKADVANFLLLNAIHIHQMARSAMTLMENGQPYSVVILARSALESMFNLRASVADSNFGPQRLAHEMDELARKLRCLAENDLWPQTRHPTAEDCKSEAARIRSLYNLPVLAKRSEIDRIDKVERIAQVADLSPYYDDDYRHLSLAVHGNQAGIINAAHGFLVKKALLALSNALFIGANVLAGVFRVKKFDEKLDSHRHEMERLMLTPDFLPKQV